jgi:hypothetical protein
MLVAGAGAQLLLVQVLLLQVVVVVELIVHQEIQEQQILVVGAGVLSMGLVVMVE